MSRTLTTSGARALSLGLVVLASALAPSAAGCGGSDEGDPSSPLCQSTREFYATQVYGKAMQACAGCHSPGGTADQRGAKFKMYRDTWPDFVSANLEALRDYAKLEYDGKPMILLKPLGQRAHGGGSVLAEDSEDFKVLKTFVADLRAGKETTCDGDGQLGVQYLDNRETARKAAITLAGHYPTDQELESVGSDEGLDQFILTLTNHELFYDRLREIWNDALLTERGVDAGVGNTYDNAPELYDDRAPGYTTEKRTWTSRAMTEEPLRFIEYVVRNNLPFSDVVEGNYIVANPFSAKLYGLPHDRPLEPGAYLDWKRIDFSPAQTTTTQGAARTNAVPMAGVLVTPAFLNRWETTPTNKGRKRARIVLKTFLATDIFKFAQRPVDSTALTSVQNPTSNSAMCNVCHTVIDPIAGAFRGFDENNMSRFNPDDKWHDDMLPPGFNTVQMPPQSYGNAIMWLGAQIPKDPRFAISVAQVMYRGIVGDEPITFPQDKAAADYADRVRAFNIQNDWFVKTGAELAASKFDLRRLVVAIVRSAYFRAKSGDPSKDGLHDGLGQGRLLGPEMLGRKFRATTGLYFWANEAAVRDETRARDGFLRSDLIMDRDWRLVYGGIDSGDVTKRTETMSPIMLATSQYTASLVACRATSYDFTKPLPERRLFKTVDFTTTPFTVRASAGAPLVAVPDAEQKIKDTIKHLYFRLLGETVQTDSEEVQRTYALFVDTWKDYEERALRDEVNDRLTFRCVAESNWDSPVRFEPDANNNIRPVFDRLRDRPAGAPYEPGMRLERDENFTVRAWQAVLTYLLMDYRFTHE
jgi:cytochrome c553